MGRVRARAHQGRSVLPWLAEHERRRAEATPVRRRFSSFVKIASVLFAYLIAALAEVPDSRRAQGRRYGMCHLLLFSALEVMRLNHALCRAKKRRLRTILIGKPVRYLERQAHEGIDPAEGDR